MSAVTGISGIQLSAASAAYAPTNSADVSAIASAYATGKQDVLTFGYDGNSAISSIDGSALAGGGATGDYVEKSAMEVAIGSGNAVSATSFAFGENNSATSRSFALGSYCAASASSIALGSGSRASSNSISVGYSGYSNNRSLSLGNRASANMDSIAAGEYSTASDNSLAVGNHAVASLESIAVGTYCRSLCGYARGQNNSGYFAFMDGTSLRAKSATAFGTCNLSGNTDSAVFVIGDGTDSATGRHDLMTISRDGEITMYSSTADTTGTGIMSSIRAISAAATGGGVDSATVSAIASSYAESAASSKLDTTAFNSADFYSTSNPSGFLTGVDLSEYATTAYVDSSVSSKLDESATADFYSTSNPSGFITGVDLSDYATTAYVDSSVSSKLDTTAYNSSDFYTTANPSGFIDSAYVDSAVSSKADSSALSSYALSADVSGTVDLVSTQSANWGGSALALSAGPGVTLSKSGDTLTVSTETVLWSGTPVNVADATAGLTLAESPYNFDRVALYWVPWNYTVNSLEKQEAVAEARITSAIPRIGSVTEWNAEASNTMFIFVLNAYFDASKFYTQAIKYFSIGDWTVNVQGTGSYITKIVGINRTAEA